MWQDFQFACGVYPAHAEFVQSVRQEVIDNVKRLRHHPSIALFCGNNEGAFSWSRPACSGKANSVTDYQMVLQWGGTRARRESWLARSDC